MDPASARTFADTRFLLSVAAAPQLPPDRGAEVAFAGRSNAGKSSAINALTGHSSLARTSKTPGRTRLLNYFEVQPGLRLLDLPGYGYAEVSNAERAVWAPLLEQLRRRQSLRGLILLVDVRRGVQSEDLELIDWADPALRPTHILLTKCDKLGRNEARSALSQAQRQLGKRATVQLFSASKGEGVADARRQLVRMLKETPATLRPPGPD
jgi:GTP-binding protein